MAHEAPMTAQPVPSEGDPRCVETESGLRSFSGEEDRQYVVRAIDGSWLCDMWLGYALWHVRTYRCVYGSPVELLSHEIIGGARDTEAQRG
jgi:hypothetical protein